MAETVIGRKYLKTLSKPQLISLQTYTLKAFFELDGIDREESLLNYFHSKIQGYIGSPYREDTAAVISIRLDENEDSYIIEEGISYKCGKVGQSIQDEVRQGRIACLRLPAVPDTAVLRFSFGRLKANKKPID